MVATVLFEQRVLNLTQDAELSTTVGPLATMALRLGCTDLAMGHPLPRTNLVKNGGMEVWHYYHTLY